MKNINENYQWRHSGVTNGGGVINIYIFNNKKQNPE